MELTKELWGKSSCGKEIYLYTIKNSKGAYVQLSSIGAGIVAVVVPDKDGNLAVWRESRHLNGIAYHNDGWVILNRNRVEGWFNSEMIRFWTSRPTDVQREATPWN